MCIPQKNYLKMKRIIFTIISLALILAHVIAQDIIPAERTIQWSPGITGDIPSYPIGVNVLDYGAVGDSITDDTQAFLDAIEACPDNQAVLIPAGKYLLTQRIFVRKPIVLKGEGIDQTYLLFEGQDNGAGGLTPAHIWFGDYNNDIEVDVIGSCNKNSYQVTVDDVTGLNAGDLIEIRQNNDTAIMTRPLVPIEDNNSWAEGHWGWRAVGQLLIISEIDQENNIISFESPLHFDYNLDMEPRISRYTNPTSNAGIEDMHIDLLNDCNGNYANIQLFGAYHCWVRNIKSNKCSRSHISVFQGLGNTIKDNYCKFGHHYSAGEGYGIYLGDRATDNLIENNVLVNLHAFMVTSVGTNGNVFSYNFTAKPLDDGGEYAVLHAAISAHGHHAYMNLFEGNYCHSTYMDTHWGSNANYIHLRNNIYRPDGYLSRNIPVEIDKNNPYMVYVGNVFHHENSIERGIVWGLPEEPDDFSDPNLTYNTLLRHGNYDYISENIFWDPGISNHIIPNSYYLEEKPEFFTNAPWGDTPWPCTGSDVLNTGIIPAQQRYCDVNNISVPVAPSALTGTVTNNTVTLNWTDNSNNENGFRIYISKDDVNYNRISVTLADSNSYTLVGLDTNTTYYFKTCAFNHFSGSSLYSNTFSATTEDRLPNDLIAWYKFDDNAVDSSDNQYDGVVSGPELITGRIDQAFLFDGIDDNIEVPSWDDPLYGDEQSFSIAAWINPDDVDGYNLVVSDDADWGNFAFGLDDERIFVQFLCNVPGENYQRYSIKSVEQGKVALHAYSHIAVTYEPINNIVRLYLNGEQVAIDRINRPLGATGFDALYIGQGSLQDQMEYFDGVIDDLRIYRSFLSANDIKDIYIEGLPSESNAPEIPGNFTANLIAGPQINLTWNESDDDSGILEYIIYRNGSIIAHVDDLSYLDTDIQESETYTYEIVAVDIFGNRSDHSSPVTITVTLPVNLRNYIITGPDIHVYPNPASSLLYINSENTYPVNFELYDLRGILLLNQVIESANQAANVEQLSNGIYLYKIRTENNHIKQGLITKGDN